ncbi:hypothetical protein M2341_003205 [Sphingobium sp. B7D2B]|uniref:DUF1993 domain-containing protein n=1 Tax=Sphingobium sp. B7D2B TaxID=2940583 RepID=UPI0022241F2A|nr:DUF1993 domain-containing protein [Sphingobium sp. B7D2B]MCW2367758.1 hypothetical protein [Sphingobium sp. B7D2B]
MTLTMHAITVPLLVNSLTNMERWLARPDVRAAEADLLGARLIEDMRPLTAQYQMASDSAKNGIARLAGIEPPAMPDTEASLDALQERCAKTIAFVQSVTPAQLDGSEDREIVLRFPNGQGYRFHGRDYVTGFMLPNFLFHATMAYALLRARGIAIGKPDFLAHLGAPVPLADPA